MASRMAFRRRLCVTYQSRGRPAGNGRFSTGAYGRSSRTGRFAVDWVGNGFGFSAAAGTGILLSRGGAPPGTTATPATPSNTASILLPTTDKTPWPQGCRGWCDAGGRRVFAYRGPMEIWINPACSKCRSAISLLDAEGADYTVR